MNRGMSGTCSECQSSEHVKQQIADAVNDKQETVTVATAIQEEILVEMGIDLRFGLACLGRINKDYENDQDLMICFYGFVAREEVACDEAELGSEKFAERIHMQKKLQEQLHQQMEISNFESEASVLSVDQIEDWVRRRLSLVFGPS